MAPAQAETLVSAIRCLGCCITNRWTGATGSDFRIKRDPLSCSVAPCPGQLRRSAAHSMKRTTSFDDVAYFHNHFRGDLIVTTGVLYYFPHTNVAAAKLENKERPTEKLAVVSHLFGLPGFLFQLVANGLFDLSMFLWRTLRVSINQPKLRQSGLWRDGGPSFELEQRLDAQLAAHRNHSGPLVGYQSSLPRAVRLRRS